MVVNALIAPINDFCIIFPDVFISLFLSSCSWWPDGTSVLLVDHKVSIVLEIQVGLWVATGFSVPHSFDILAVDNKVTIGLHYHETNLAIMIDFKLFQINDLTIFVLVDDELLVALKSHWIDSAWMEVALITSSKDDPIIFEYVWASCLNLDCASHAEDSSQSKVFGKAWHYVVSSLVVLFKVIEICSGLLL